MGRTPVERTSVERHWPRRSSVASSRPRTSLQFVGRICVVENQRVVLVVQCSAMHVHVHVFKEQVTEHDEEVVSPVHCIDTTDVDKVVRL